MTFLLREFLTDFQLNFLELIQYLYETLSKAERQKEPLITLQYYYVASMFGCSHTSIVNALNRLQELGLIEAVSNDFGQCATYHYIPSAYRSLVKRAKARKCTLITCRTKQRQTVAAADILDYMTGKAIRKAAKRRSKRK